MTLEEFISLNYHAAIRLYQTGRMALLTTDPRYLSGEATAQEAMVLLLQHQLSRKDANALSKEGLRRREQRQGTHEARILTSVYRGVSAHPRGWRVMVATNGGHKQHIGVYPTQLAAARAYDAYVLAHYPQKATNVALGLLQEA